MRKPLDEGKAEGPPLIIGEAAYRVVQAPAAKSPPDLVVDVVRGLVQLEVYLGCMALGCRLAAHGVDCLVAGQREHPRTQRATRGVEPAWFPPNGHERVLDRFLGKPLGPGDAHGYGVHSGRETLVEYLDGVLVAGGDPRQQFSVLHHRLAPGGSG